MMQGKGDSHQSNPGDHNIIITNSNGMCGMFAVGLLLFHTSVSRHKKKRWDSGVHKIRVPLCLMTMSLLRALEVGQPNKILGPES